jgi:hypothetical protein
LPVIAIPGDDAWEAWDGRRCSPVGMSRSCSIATRQGGTPPLGFAADLKAAGVRGSVIDLASRRHDGYDLTDWLASRPELHGAELCWALGAPGTRARSHAAQGPGR